MGLGSAANEPDERDSCQRDTHTGPEVPPIQIDRGGNVVQASRTGEAELDRRKNILAIKARGGRHYRGPRNDAADAIRPSQGHISCCATDASGCVQLASSRQNIWPSRVHMFRVFLSGPWLWAHSSTHRTDQQVVEARRCDGEPANPPVSSLPHTPAHSLT